jgi:hypothetical protein
LLSNDTPILGPWANSTNVNVFTAIVIAMLVALSVILTASTLFPNFGIAQILWTLGAGFVGALGVALWLARTRRAHSPFDEMSLEEKLAWRMPSLDHLAPARLSAVNRFWLLVLRVYLIGAVGLVVYKVSLLALHRG